MHSLTVLLKKEKKYRSEEKLPSSDIRLRAEVTEAVLNSSTSPTHPGHRVLHGTSSSGHQAGLYLTRVRVVNTTGAALGLDSFMQLPVPQQREGPGGRGRGAIALRTQASLGHPGLQPHRQRPS